MGGSKNPGCKPAQSCVDKRTLGENQSQNRLRDVFSSKGSRMLRQIALSSGVLISLSTLAGVEGPSNPPVLGPESAPVTVTVGLDYECRFSQRFLEETVDKLDKKFPGKLKFVIRHYPLEFHVHAQAAAEAAVCAQRQGQYAGFQKAVLTAAKDGLSPEKIKSIGKTIAKDPAVVAAGFSVAQFENCLELAETKERVKADKTYLDARKIVGTPTPFIGDNPPVANSLSAIEAAIKKELASQH
jgi:protein-disulfide isomerase